MIEPTLRWDGERLGEARLPLPEGRTAIVRPRAAEHPILGVCDAISIEPDARTVARSAAIDWHAPAFIPALDVPGALPAGAGTAILNLLAIRAREAGCAALRYRGPYPTAALFDALLGSFRLAVAPADALARLCTDVEEMALRGETREVAVDFVPAPHRWRRVSARVVVQIRDGIERAWIDGKPYDRDRAVTRRLRVEGDRRIASVVIAGSVWADVLAFAPDGTPLGEPAPLPPAPPDPIGLVLPEALAAVLREIVTDRAPPWSRERVASVLARPVVFGDTGEEPARVRDDAIELHSAIAQRALELDADRLLAIVVDALEPAVLRAAASSHARGGGRSPTG